jgi:predicted anti-sigma-YlaC factor YlaD
MDCKDVRKKISEIIDGGLYENLPQDVRKHISVCNECRKFYENEMLIWKMLDCYPSIEPSADFVEKVMRKVRATKVAAKRVFSRIIAAVGTAVAVIIVAILLFAPSELGPELSVTEVAEILEKEDLLANLDLAEEWEAAALMDLLESVEDLELESE